MVRRVDGLLPRSSTSPPSAEDLFRSKLLLCLATPRAILLPSVKSGSEGWRPVSLSNGLFPVFVLKHFWDPVLKDQNGFEALLSSKVWTKQDADTKVQRPFHQFLLKPRSREASAEIWSSVNPLASERRFAPLGRRVPEPDAETRSYSHIIDHHCSFKVSPALDGRQHLLVQTICRTQSKAGVSSAEDRQEADHSARRW